MTPEEFEPRPVSKFIEIAGHIVELLGYYSNHGDPDRDDPSAKQARAYREEAMKLAWELESLVGQSVEFALEMDLNADAVNQHLGNYSSMVRHFGDWESLEEGDEWGGYANRIAWQGPTFDELREVYLALKREPHFLTLLKAEPRQLIPQRPVVQQTVIPIPVTPRQKGVTLLDAALVLEGFNKDGQTDGELRRAAVAMKTLWGKRKPFMRKLGWPIGKAPDDPQADLFDPVALSDALMTEKEGYRVVQIGQKEFLRQLKERQREPLLLDLGK